MRPVIEKVVIEYLPSDGELPVRLSAVVHYKLMRDNKDLGAKGEYPLLGGVEEIQAMVRAAEESVANHLFPGSGTGAVSSSATTIVPLTNDET